MEDPITADALLEGLWSHKSQPEDFAKLSNEQEREKALDVLIAMVTDPHPWYRERAIKALEVLRDRRAVEPLIASLAADESDFDNESNLLEAKVDALVAIGDPEAILPLLSDDRVHTDWVLRRKLLEFGKEDLLHVLSEATTRPDDSLRELSLSVLGYINDPRSVKLLIEALDDQKASIRSQSVFYLGQLMATESVPFLLSHAVDVDTKVRQYTAIALGKLGDTQAVPALLPLLNDQEQSIRFHAAIALGKLGDSSGLELIRDYIAVGYDSSHVYLDDALEALKTLRAPAVPLLINLTNKLLQGREHDLNLLALVAEILGEQGDAAALEVLEKMLAIKIKSVRQAAQQAIAKIRK